MLFTLIKNEIIKLLRRGKTWIVFALFALFIGITIYGQYSQDKNVRVWQSPEKQLEMARENLDYYNKELENSKGLDASPEYIASLEESIEYANEQIKTYEKMIEEGTNEGWREELDEEIKYTQEDIKRFEKYDDEWSTQYVLERKEDLEELIYLKDNDIKPLYGWEYDSYNYMKNLMQFLGMAILVAGIAVFMSDIVSGEYTPATLKFLLIQPVTRGKVLLSKFIAVTMSVLSMILGGELLGFLFVRLTSGMNTSNYPVEIGAMYEEVINSEGTIVVSKIAGSGHMGTNLELFIKSMLFQVLFIITACAVIFMISTLIKSSMITMAVSVISTVFLTIGSTMISPLKKIAHLIFLNFADSISIFTGNTSIMMQNSNITIRNGIIVMIITLIVSYLIAYFNFNKKDILI